ncbi:hypothetical protein C8R44DRAFT_856744 [Mycena epipterygia]|nr:hypothetical protein C8R44DRAFT_856744 [Mycena epipterygia]
MVTSQLSLDGTLGSLEIGTVLATFLYGIQTLQTFNYYREYPEDGVMLKTFVAIVGFLELGHTICSCHAMYLTTVTFYGQPQHIMDPPLSLIFTTFFHSGIIIVVQTFFAFRVATLSRRWSMTILCCLLNLLRLACILVIFAKLCIHPDFSILVTELHRLMITSFSIGPIVDFIIATALVYDLWRARDSHWTETTHIVDTIIVWTVETTMITSISGLLTIILFLARDDLTWTIFYLIQAKLFSNSMLASLNGRQRFRRLEPPHPNSGSHVIVFHSSPETRSSIQRTLGAATNDMSHPSKQVVEMSNHVTDTQ